MSTLVYSPGVKVYIDSTRLGEIVDVSSSLTGLSMQRRADGVSQLQLGLTNPLRKYDNVFTPNDRIVVVMKRLTWMRTFTGYLNSVPVFSSWPRDVSLSASCSLKRLQYFYWDPQLAASNQLVRDSLIQQEDGSAPDGGVKQIVINLLEEVADWSGAFIKQDASLAGTKIHIGGIPRNWFDFAAEILKSVAEDVLEHQAFAASIAQRLGSGSTLAGSEPINGRGEVPAGTANLNPEQIGNATKILNAAAKLGATAREMELIIGCVRQESTLYQYWNPRYPETQSVPGARKGTDHDSVGFYQQRPSQGWGTPAQCMDVDHSTKKFLEALRGVKNYLDLPFTVAIQKVQRSAYPNHYAQWEPLAKQVVAGYLGTLQVLGDDPLASDRSPSGGGTSAGVPQTSVANPRQADRQDSQRGATQSGNRNAPGTTTGTQLCITAQQAIQNAIPYVFGSTTAPDDPNPSSHDCSSFVRWVYFQSLGQLNGMPRVSADQYEWSRSQGREISVEDGLRTPGALMWRGRGGLKVGHVEYSLGDGRTIGTRKTGTNASIVTARSGYWSYATLPPAVNYPNNPAAVPAIGGDGTGAAGGGAGAAAVATQLERARTSAEAVLAGVQTGDSPFGSSPWRFAQESSHSLSNGLTGDRALSNDAPLLPYIQTLMNATMRQFCSAPNGDFIGWFPDYYGIWGTAAKMVLQPIEVADFTVDYSDEYMVTHQYVVGTQEGNTRLDLSTGDIDAVKLISRFTSFGIATIDNPAILGALFGISPTSEEARAFTHTIYERYGPRPNYVEIPGITGPDGEFFMALFLFMQNWTAQFNANIDITFMPELFPGMLIQFPEYNFQAYVNTVDHSIAFGPGGGFKTTINIQAPARIKDLGPSDELSGLPLAGAKGKSSSSSSRPSGKSVAPGIHFTNPRQADRAAGYRDKPKPQSNPRLERLV